MKKIWAKTPAEYAEFSVNFVSDGGKATLRITACHNYAVYVNGEFLANGQYADIPQHKSIDSIPFQAKEGTNTLFILASTTPADYQTVRQMPSFVAFEVLDAAGRVLCSSEDACSRPSTAYRYGDTISRQLGMGWTYDFTAQPMAWEAAVSVQFETKDEPRPIAKTVITEPIVGEFVAQGIFAYRGGKTAAEQMQLAWMSSLRFAEMTGENRLVKAKSGEPLAFAAQEGDGVFFIMDLQKNCSGYPLFSVVVEKPCRAIFAWGEHLSDLRIRAERAGRNFASEIQLKAGENNFEGYIRRIGCRYMCLFLETNHVTVRQFSLREELYPFKDIQRDFGDRLLNKIYEVGKRTLQLCAHEHYEDCPWREQALYGMDSRNQMLFGYSAFEEYELPRASIRLFAYALGEDGLLSLCAPARTDITIPVFSLYWILAICENAEADYNCEFVREMIPYAERILQVYQQRTGEYGVERFSQTRYWNFHEWSDGLDGEAIFRDEEIEAFPEAISTALALYAARAFAKLEEKEGFLEKAEEYRAYAKTLAEKLEYFYDAEKGLYKSYLADRTYNYHGYTQAILLCTGEVPQERVDRLCKELENSLDSIPMTYACLPWKYEAWVRYQKNGVELAVEDICQQFGAMLFKGATTYWETAKGEADFDDAGSLCHGWSAVACYIFERYLQDKNRL